MRSNGLTSSSSDATRPSPSKLGWRSLLPRLATALTVLLVLCVTVWPKRRLVRAMISSTSNAIGCAEPAHARDSSSRGLALRSLNRSLRPSMQASWRSLLSRFGIAIASVVDFVFLLRASAIRKRAFMAFGLASVLLSLTTSCSTSRKATEVSRSVLTTDYTNLTDKHDSVTVIIRDTLREVLGRAKRQSRATTITIRENEQGDTLRVSTVTDRERLTTRDLARASEVKIVERIDTVYIQKDSVSVEDKKIGLSASADGGPKRSGLSELFLCHDSGKPKRAWSLLSLLHRFLTYVKWILAIAFLLLASVVLVRARH